MSPRIILDTDIDTDCDDAGALAVLHALVTARECTLLGVICSAPVSECVGAVRTINAAYGRAKIPVAAVHVADYETADHWKPYRDHREWFLKGEFAGAYNGLLAGSHTADAPPPAEAVSMYRRLLAKAPKRSVTICAIGTLTALAQLLQSEGDEHSRLTGPDLVREKVRELVTMAIGSYPAGRDEFNWRMDLPSAAAVLRDWPTVVTVSEKGHTIMTGARFMAAAPCIHPVRQAYFVYLRSVTNNRPSRDQVAVLYAVRGLAAPYALSGDHTLVLDTATGEHVWTTGSEPGKGRRCVTTIVTDTAMASIVESLMIASVKS